MRGRRRRTRRSGMRRQTDWIPQVNDGAFFQIDISTTPALIALVDEVDIEEKQDHLTIERVVGEVFVYTRAVSGNLTEAIIYAGIIVSDVDTSSGVTPFSPSDDDDSEGEWLWRRAWGFFPATAADVRVLNAEWPTHLDVRVRRKMSQRQALLLCITAVPTPFSTGVLAPTDIDVALNIRTLVKLF